MPAIDCGAAAIREINGDPGGARRGPRGRDRAPNPGARHNLGVACSTDVARHTSTGSVGYYCGGMNDGATVEIRGSAGWGLAEGMLSGTVVVDGNAGNGAAASIRGGTVVVRGDCAARAGVAMKGGLLLIGGDCRLHGRVHDAEGRDRHLRRRRRGAGRLDVRGRRFVGGEIASLGQRRGRVGGRAPDELADARGRPSRRYGIDRADPRSGRSVAGASSGTSTSKLTLADAL